MAKKLKKVTGTSKNDIINMSKQTRDLDINAKSGNDTIIVGRGNDTITGGKGSNTVVYNEGSGKDVIKLTKGEKLTIKYVSNSDLTINNFSIKESGKDVVITRKFKKNGVTKTDKITIANMTKNSLAKSVVFQIEKSSSSYELSRPELTFDIKNGYYTIDNNKNKVNGTNLNEKIFGTTGNDTIKGYGGNDIIDAGVGNDKLYGGSGDDTFIFGTYHLNNRYYGSGKDTIMDVQKSDVVQFTNSLAEKLVFVKKKRDLVIKYYDKDDLKGATKENTVTIKDYYNKKGAVAKSFKIKALNASGNLADVGYAGTVMSSSFKNAMAKERAAVLAAKEAEEKSKLEAYNTLVEEKAAAEEALTQANAEKEQLETDITTVTEEKETLQEQVETLVTNSINMVYGTTDNDSMAGTDNNDIFLPNGAADTITSANYAKDKLVLTGDLAHVSYEREFGSDDLTVKYKDGSVLLKNYFNNNGNLDTIVLNGSEHKISSTLDSKLSLVIDGVVYRQLTGTSGDDSFIPTSDKEIFITNGGNDYYGSFGYNETNGDKIKLLGNKSDVSYSKDSTDLIINYSGGKIRMEGYYDGSGNYYYYGTLVTDDNEFSISDDLSSKGYTVIGTSGDDYFYPKSDKEIFITNGGEDYFGSFGYNETNGDKIKLLGNKSDVSYSKDPNSSSNLIINYNGGKITMYDYYDGDGNSNYYGTLVTEDGQEFSISDDISSKGVAVTGSSGDDSFIPTSDKEIFIANGGEDYFGSLGYSYDETYGDKIKLSGNKSDVSYSLDPNDSDALIINYSGGKITMDGYYDSDGNSNYYGTLVTDDDEFSISDDLSSKGLYIYDNGEYYKAVLGTSGDDSFSPTSDKETFIANGGDDSFYCCYDSSSSYVPYDIYDDAIKISAKKDDLVYLKDDKDLRIYYPDGSVTMYYYDKNEDSKNVKIITDDAEFEVRDDYEAKSGNNLTDSDDYVALTSGNQEINALAGTDRIVVNSSNNTICGGAGDDIVYNLYGYNTYVFNSGDGNDTFSSINSSDKLNFADTKFEDWKFSKSGNNLVISYSDNDSVTIKNYSFYNDPSLTDSDGTQYNSGFDVRGNNYRNYNTLISENTVIYDFGGDDDYLRMSNNAAKIKIACNIKADGSADPMRVLSNDDYTAWKTDTTSAQGGVHILGEYGSIESIKSNDFKTVTLAEMNQLKADVTAWLTSHTDYADVSSAIANQANDTDVANLIAIYDNFNNTAWAS